MGMFDELTCKYTLPKPEAQGLLFQTKDTPSQWLDLYEIREDGTLWHEDYDIEDHSDKALGKGEDEFIGCMAKVNKRWEPVHFIGEIVFYGSLPPYGSAPPDAQRKHFTFSAYFVDGKLNQLHSIE